MTRQPACQNETAVRSARSVYHVGRMTRYEILDALLHDGFEIDAADAAEISETIQQAARAGALTWTPNRIVSTLFNHPLTIYRSLAPPPQTPRRHLP